MTQADSVEESPLPKKPIVLKVNYELLKSSFVYIVICFGFYALFSTLEDILSSPLSEIAGIVATVSLATIPVILIYYVLSSDKAVNEAELGQIILERQKLNTKIEQKSEPDVFDTARLNLNHLNEYYAINKNQAKSSFIFSIIAIVLGLSTIIAGIWLYYYKDSNNINTVFLTSISGILLEFIGGAYFYMYKKSLEQVNIFFSQLIKVQDTMLAVSLAKDMTSKDKSAEVIEKIIDSLLERSLK